MKLIVATVSDRANTVCSSHEQHKLIPLARAGVTVHKDKQFLYSTCIQRLKNCKSVKTPITTR